MTLERFHQLTLADPRAFFLPLTIEADVPVRIIEIILDPRQLLHFSMLDPDE